MNTRTVITEAMLTKERWLREARRYALHAFCYETMPDEFVEHFAAHFNDGDSPYDAVDAFGEEYNLDRCDGFYGINSGKTFVKNA